MDLILLIGFGGAIGAVLRYLLSMGITYLLPYHFPVATMTINILGGALIGVLFVALQGHSYETSLRAFLLTGILGGFTTFSAFSLETCSLIESARYGAALVYVLASVLLSVSATMLAIKILRIG